ncbi:potassium channel family protein [Sphaerobacter thermophilus]|jgi:trk system potassium uptake protein TrkA|uniref:Trk system potassium uptake protein TrkA n=1 Tax=Sphaerobacter thermophilus (strain ATCC 49802 / DSM 20745 / KCCM 41009 / NCIMB 13125 / S 6022) TaxID=479434 RepID=D1C4B2_SPHTD|nr:NAD-binding protein [Sphaerobacter thermophilus]ACZ39079.1 TrkA-N domain protein [Sphaerobacter thermophilus DSM 20745]PZN59747.1 MAG: portal protein [Sphaerobacter thermophilus]
MYIIVVGGGKVGYYLTKTLVHEGYEVFLIEKNPIKCQIYAERFGAVVMQGDGAEAAILEAAGAGRADVVIAVTGDDEDNLVICQMAKERFGVARVIARVNNPKNEELFRKLGIDVTVSQTNVILSIIEQQIPERPFVHLLALRHADLAIVEAKVSDDSPVVNQPIERIQFPPEVNVTAVLRAGDLIIPTGQTVIRAGDEIIAVTKREREEELRHLLVD